MELKKKKNISQKDKEFLLNTLNSMFVTKPSSYGYKHDIEAFLKELGINEDEYFTVVLDSFSKEKKNNDDSVFITSYLFFMEEFIKLLKSKESYKKELKLVNYLMHLSTEVFYLSLQKDMILIKYGDKGNKAYINLFGQVDVIVPNSKMMNVFEKDYLLYLASLIKYKEYDLINFVLNDNFSNYPLIIYDDISQDEEIPVIFENLNKSKKKFTTFIKGKNDEISKILFDINNFINNLKLNLNRQRKRTQRIKIITEIEDENKISQDDEQYQKNSFQKSLKLNSSNEELALSLEIYIISLRQLLNLFNFYYYNDTDEEIINCSSEHYINRLNIPVSKEKLNINKTKYLSNNSFFELKIYFYSKVISLGKGHFFGELALRNSNAERTATIITSSDCHFAYLNRKTYNTRLKTKAELDLKYKLTFFRSLPIFIDIPLIIFYKKYYTHISKHYLMKNVFAIKQGEKPNQLCLLNKGTYELISNMNLKDLTELIFYFIEKVKKYQTFSEQNDSNLYKDILISLRESNERVKILLSKNSNFHNPFTKEHIMKISEMSCPDITGFEEIIGKDGLYAFSLQAKTMENIIYSMDFNFYKDLYNKNPLVQKKHNHIIKIKLDLIIKRLLKIRTNIINSFKNRKSENDISSIITKEIEKINNQKKVGKRFLNLKNTKWNFENNKNISFDIKDHIFNEKVLFNHKFNHRKYSKTNSKVKKNSNISNNNKDLVLENKTDDLENKKENDDNIFEASKTQDIKRKDQFNYTTYKFFPTENSKYMHLVPIINLRKSAKSKRIKTKTEENNLTEIKNFLRGKTINKSIKCYFDKKIKITDSFNFTEKIRRKRKLLKLENEKLNSILLKKKEVSKNIPLSSKKYKPIKIMNNTDNNNFNSPNRLMTQNNLKNIDFNMLELTDRSLNLANTNSIFHKNIQKLINSPNKNENKKEKIEEILKENKFGKNINDFNKKKERKFLSKRDDNYKRNLIRIKLFYGIDKK